MSPSQTRKNRRFLIAVGFISAFLLVVGKYLDDIEISSTTPLFVAFMASSLIGVSLGRVSRATPQPTSASGVAMLVCCYIGWRVSYFPIMVVAGTGAAFFEFTCVTLELTPWVYGPFLLCQFGLHAIVARLAVATVLTNRRGVWIASLIGLALASCMSFSKLVDVHPLPDRCWSLDAQLTAHEPAGNPYLKAFDQNRHLLHQQLLLLAAGSTYDVIPHSPWSQAVQGTLEMQFKQNPNGSTVDRVKEHYFGYLAAHSRITKTTLSAGKESQGNESHENHDL
jgi:hypothetical protein